ncbi:ankyrin [Mollisia scopiformis]|uniref:Ankyrin n=1 Tax=Mollisia scopiformis TaxID=149040 RepID=A0A132B8E3_MOLSC|nr:ankyrin [Mollisia scopiformis]KUJ08641.1 ankyrin [Mollisia scopiformis]
MLCVQGTAWKGQYSSFVNYLFDEFPKAHSIDYRKAHSIDYRHLLTTVSSLDWSKCFLDAAYNSTRNVLEIFLAHKADPNAVEKDSKAKYGTPLIAAVSGARPENVKFLLDNNADVNANAKVGDYGTALIAICSKEIIHQGILELILGQSTINVNVVSSTGSYATALIAACAKGHLHIAKMLRVKECKLDMMTDYGTHPNALSAAVEAESIRSVVFLLDFGATAQHCNRKIWSPSYIPPWKENGANRNRSCIQVTKRELISSIVWGAGDEISQLRELKVRGFGSDSRDEIAKNMAKAFGFSTRIPAITNGFSWIIQESTANILEWSEAVLLWRRLIRLLDIIEDENLTVEDSELIPSEQKNDISRGEWYKALDFRPLQRVFSIESEGLFIEQGVFDEGDDQEFVTDDEEIAVDEREECLNSPGEEQWCHEGEVAANDERGEIPNNQEEQPGDGRAAALEKGQVAGGNNKEQADLGEQETKMGRFAKSFCCVCS